MKAIVIHHFLKLNNILCPFLKSFYKFYVLSPKYLQYTLWIRIRDSFPEVYFRVTVRPLSSASNVFHTGIKTCAEKVDMNSGYKFKIIMLAAVYKYNVQIPFQNFIWIWMHYGNLTHKMCWSLNKKYLSFEPKKWIIIIMYISTIRISNNKKTLRLAKASAFSNADTDSLYYSIRWSYSVTIIASINLSGTYARGDSRKNL